MGVYAALMLESLVNEYVKKDWFQAHRKGVKERWVDLYGAVLDRRRYDFVALGWMALA